MKEAYYFSHDNNARNDPKCSALICEYGPEGYGVYWMIIEVLAEQENYKLKKFNKLYFGLAKQFVIEVEKLRSIIEALLHEYELLYEDENYIWSESLLRRMNVKEKKRQAKVDAGRLGGLKSGVTRKNKSKNEANEAVLQAEESTLEANEPKERKVKESKVKENKEKEKIEDEIDASSLNEIALELCKYYSELKPMQNITQHLATLKIFLQDYGFDWCKEALQKTVIGTDKFVPNYMLKILKDWAAEGKPQKKGDTDGSTGPNTKEGKGKFSGFKPPEPKTTGDTDTTGLI